MSPSEPRPLVFGLRIALWYATLFVVGALAIVFLTYSLTAESLAQRDRQIIRGKLGDYAAAYARGGVRVLAATVRAEQEAAPERLFVRVVNRGVEAVVLSNAEGWDPATLETDSGDLTAAGTIFGKQFLRLVRLGQFGLDAKGKARPDLVPGVFAYVRTLADGVRGVRKA